MFFSHSASCFFSCFLFNQGAYTVRKLGKRTSTFNSVHRVTCTKMFDRRLKMTDHMRTHTGERFVACLNCGQTFNSYVKFYDHFRRQALNSEYILQQSKSTSTLILRNRVALNNQKQKATSVINASKVSIPKNC